MCDAAVYIFGVLCTIAAGVIFVALVLNLQTRVPKPPHGRYTSQKEADRMYRELRSLRLGACEECPPHGHCALCGAEVFEES